MKAIIMAAGKGTRLLPLTATRPKPMMPMLNQPMIDHMMGIVREAGIEEATVLVDYLSDQIVQHLADGSAHGMKVEFTTGNIKRGTAGAVKNAISGEKEPFLVTSADVLTSINLKKMIEAHSNSNAQVTMMLSTVTDTSQYGVVELDDNERVVRFQEKPRREEAFSNLVNSGIYVCNPEVFSEVPADTPTDFSKQLFPAMLKKGIPIHGYSFNGYWNDVGLPSTYLAATEDMVEGRLEGEEGGAGDYLEEPTFGRLVTGRGCEIDASAMVDGFAVLGDNVKIGKGVRLSRSIIYSNTAIGDTSVVSEAIVGEGVELGRSVTLDEGVVIGDRTSIGMESRIGYNIKIWHHSRLGPGTKMLHT